MEYGWRDSQHWVCLYGHVNDEATLVCLAKIYTPLITESGLKNVETPCGQRQPPRLVTAKNKGGVGSSRSRK